MSRNTFGIVPWNWSSHSGRRRAPRARQSDTRRLRPGLLALEGRTLLSSSPTMYTVTDTSDNVGDTGSLCYAIAQANANTNTAGSEITFDTTDFATQKTITLSSTLVLNETAGPEVIDGPAAGVVISGNNAVEVFKIESGVSAPLSDLTITGGNEPGTAGEGGGLNNEGTTSLSNCTISGNIAGDHGGGLYNGGKATLTLTDCTVNSNYASVGGGLDNNGNGTLGLSLTECTISGNAAGDHGGGLDNGEGANLTLSNCTINGNTADTNGGAGGLNNFGTATLTDTIVAGNTNGNGDSDIGGTVNVGGSYNLIGKGGAGGLTGSTNQVNVTNPGLAALGDYGGPTETIALQFDSPAVGKGTAVKGVTNDQRGFTVGSSLDIGAFQTQTQSGTLVVDTTTDGVGAAPGELDLRAAVNLANLATVSTAINFDPVDFATVEKITLASLLGLTNTSVSETITGSAVGLAISGGGQTGVFHVGSGVTATFSLLTITDGNATGASGAGAGIYNEGKSLTLTDCTIDGNTASSDGGGLDNVGTANLTLIDCTVSGNTAGLGGGLFNGSTAKQALTLIACTVSANYADQLGGGLYTTGAATLTDTIVAGNTKDGSPSDIHDNGTISGSNNLIGIGGSGTFTNGADNNDVLDDLSSLGLAPLGFYGGPTKTMALLPGSAAISAGNDNVSGVTIPSTDERGFALDSHMDIGAFQTQSGLVVNTTIDGTNAPFGDLSLREAINIANAPGAPKPGTAEPITFDATVFATHQTITLTRGQLELSKTSGSETITGSAAGVTISGGGQSRVFQVDSGVTAMLTSLTITAGNANGGGGLYNQGMTNLADCTVSGNSADFGGGLDNYGTGTIALTDCTISGNSAEDHGGGLENGPTANLKLIGSTISGNESEVLGGGLFNDGAATLTNTIVAGNTRNGSASDIHNDGTISSASAFNLIGTGGSGTLAGGKNGNSVLTSLADLGLAPLGDYGGPTETMPPLPGSAAIGAGGTGLVPSGDKTDERGQYRTINGTVDIGAVETQGYTLIGSSTTQTAFPGAAFTAPLTVTVKPNNANDPVDGGVVTFTAPTSGASATLSATSVTIAGGSASVAATANSSVGSYTIGASTLGAAEEADFQLTNLTITPAVAVVASAGSVVSGQSVTFTATVTAPGGGTPTGTVTFTDGGTILGTASLDGSGTATLTTSSLAVGAQSITASYGGDTYRASATSAQPATVSVAPGGSQVVLVPFAEFNGKGKVTSLELEAEIEPLFPGAGLPTPTGAVTFELFKKGSFKALGTAALIGGTATLPTSPTRVLNKPIKVIYGGDVDFQASTLTTTIKRGSLIPLARPTGRVSTSLAAALRIRPAMDASRREHRHF